MKKTFLLFLCLLGLAGLFLSCDGTCHHLNMKSETTAPDCEHEGYTLHTCPDCGYSYKSDFVAPIGHSITSVVTQPSCEEEGYTTFSCSVCNYSYRSEYTSPTGHTFEVATVASTCTEAGHKEHLCTVCGYSYSSDFEDALGHDFRASIKRPTCTEEGYTKYTCKVCGLSYRSDYVSAKGHSFEATATSPTWSKAGVLHNTCSVCGEHFDNEPIYYSELLLSTDNNDRIFAKGVDLSYHNGDVDFAAVKEAGIGFVILRAGFLGSSVDPKFEAYYAAATEAGLEIGCYLYTESTTVDGIHEDVARLLDYLEGKKLSYPIYLDMETEVQKALPTETLILMAKAFAKDLLDAGYFPGLYTNPDWLASVYGSENDPALYLDIWLAHHNQSLYQTNQNHYAGKYGVWQYTGSEITTDYETVPGVSGRVDINVSYKNYPSIIKKYGYNGY